MYRHQKQFTFKQFPISELLAAVYELAWENTVQPDRRQIALWRRRIACSVPKATNTHSEYVRLHDDNQLQVTAPHSSIIGLIFTAKRHLQSQNKLNPIKMAEERKY